MTLSIMRSAFERVPVVGGATAGSAGSVGGVGTFRGRGLLLLCSLTVGFGLELELVRLLSVVSSTGQARLTRHLLALLPGQLGVLGGLLDCLVVVSIVRSLAHLKLHYPVDKPSTRTRRLGAAC